MHGAARPSKVTLLSAGVGSLATATLPGDAGTLHVLGDDGGISVAPDAQFTVTFGRNEPEVHVCVGEDDTFVSRQQGTIEYGHGRWLLTNLGHATIRRSDGSLILTGARTDLPAGYSALFVVTRNGEHLLQTNVIAGRPPDLPPSQPDTSTQLPGTWSLSAQERLVLVCLSQRYLRHDPHPQPLTWEHVARDLQALEPDTTWSRRKAAHIVTAVRKRMSGIVPGLLEHDVVPPVGNALNHNLIVELLAKSTLTPVDLHLLGDD